MINNNASKIPNFSNKSDNTNNNYSSPITHLLILDSKAVLLFLSFTNTNLSTISIINQYPPKISFSSLNKIDINSINLILQSSPHLLSVLSILKPHYIIFHKINQIVEFICFMIPISKIYNVNSFT
jgi:hypothetical protein